MKLSVRWTKHLKTKEEKEKFTQQLKSSKEVLDVLRGLLEEDLEASRRKSYAEDAYKMASWGLFQADKIAEQRTLFNLMSLIHITND